MASARHPADLVQAARNNDLDALEEILERYPSQVVSDYGVNAMQQACLHGNIDMIKSMIRHGADLNSFDADDSTPLHYAVNGNQAEVVDLLLKNGASYTEKNSPELTAPQAAFGKKLKECIKVFKLHDQNIVFKPDITSVENFALSDLQEDYASNTPSQIMREQELKETDDEEKCVYCRKNVAMIKFRPCEHLYACLECCAGKEVCECGEPIVDRSFEDNSKLMDYIANIKENRRNTASLEMMSKKLKETEDMLDCPICSARRIDCTLACGHLFCRVCVRKWKNKDSYTYLTPFKCCCCQKNSRYTPLFSPWGGDDKN